MLENGIAVKVTPLKKKGQRVLHEHYVEGRIKRLVISCEVDLDKGDFIEVTGPGKCGSGQFRIVEVIGERTYEIKPDLKFI